MSAIKQMVDRTYTTEYEFPRENTVLYCCVKRFTDLTLAVMAMPLCLMVYLIVAVAIKLTDKGPVLYKSVRVGKDGRHFYIYKFRTMKLNADRLEDFLSEEELKQYKTEYKLEKDPRVTVR